MDRKGKPHTEGTVKNGLCSPGNTRRGPAFRRFIGMLICVMIVMWVTTPRDCKAFQEHEVKAVFLFNFAKYVEWPAGSFSDQKEPVIIGLIGKDPFGSAIFDVIQNKTVNGRGVLVKRFANIGELDKCHILFISSQSEGEVSVILKAAKKFNVLTVGELNGKGGAKLMINMVVEREKVRFDINPGIAQKSGLKISSQLLKLARTIRDDS